MRNEPEDYRSRISKRIGLFAGVFTGVFSIINIYTAIFYYGDPIGVILTSPSLLPLLLLAGLFLLSAFLDHFIWRLFQVAAFYAVSLVSYLQQEPGYLNGPVLGVLSLILLIKYGFLIRYRVLKISLFIGILIVVNTVYKLVIREYPPLSILNDYLILGALFLIFWIIFSEEIKTYVKKQRDLSEKLEVFQLTNRELDRIIRENTSELINANRQLENKVKQLRESEGSLARALETKEVLLHEVHHRVKNNLAVISSLLEIQLDGVDSEEVRRALLSSVSRIKTMALIHEQVYSRNMDTLVELNPYLEELLEQLKSLYRERAYGVRFICEVDPVTLPIEKAVPCGLAVHECVVNSLKHAFAPGEEGEIRIEGGNREGSVVLAIADNGRGIYASHPPEEAQHRHRSPGSMGKDLILLLVERQLKGKVQIEGVNGTRWILSFPA